MKLTDKALGYLAIAAALLLTVTVMWQMYVKSAEGVESVTVLFPQLGSLQPEDAVVERGVHVGHIRSVALGKSGAEVVIDFDLPVKYSVGTRFINSNYSLMGQRYVVILPEHSGPLLNLKEQIDGEYEAGIAEAMHLVEHAVKSLDTIKTAVELLAAGTDQSPGFARQFQGVVGQLDGALGALHRSIDQNGPRLGELIAEGNRFASDAVGKTEEIRGTLDTLWGDVGELLRSLSGAIETAGSGLLTVARGLDSLSENEVWKGVADNSSLHDSLLVMTQQLRNVIDVLSGNAQSQAKIGFWKVWKHTNWNIFGATAREKRAKRARQAGE